MLPKIVFHEIESICKNFLWRGPSLQAGGAKNAWKTICRPAKEGGLGIRSLYIRNKALSLKHVWSQTAGDRSIWSCWVRANLHAKDHFWVLKIPNSGSWGWRKLLQLRHIAQDHIRWRVGDGKSISLWFDQWSQLGLLYKIVPNSSIYNSRLPPLIDELFQGQNLSTYHSQWARCLWMGSFIQAVCFG